MKYKIFRSNWLFYGILLILFMNFFTEIHPLVAFDTDDWMHFGKSRGAYPSLSFWNPSKILPECGQILTGLIGAHFIAPLIHDYVYGIIYANALVVSLAIILYLYSVQKLLEFRFKTSRLTGFAIVALYALFHFLILRTHWGDNFYLWYSEDVTCYYHYIIPNMLCTSMLMWMMRHQVLTLGQASAHKCWIIATYLALFSNLYASVTLVAYVGTVLLFDLFGPKKQAKGWLTGYIQQHSYYLLIIGLWLVVQFFEINGTRANAYGNIDAPFFESVYKTLRNLAHNRFNTLFLVITALTVVGAKAYDYRCGSKSLWHIGQRQTMLLVALVLSVTYIVLLTSKVDVTYVNRADVIFSIVFFYLLLFALCLGYLCSRSRLIAQCVPLLVMLTFFELPNMGTAWRGVQADYGLDGHECIQTERDIIQQVLQAEAAGQDTAIVIVPVYTCYKDNWPLAFDCSESVGLTLHRHGVTRRKIVTIFKNEEPIIVEPLTDTPDE